MATRPGRVCLVLAILTTHPIQYQVPLWQAIAKEGSIPFEVWYLTNHGVRPTYDEQFGKAFSWDLDTLTGYPYRFLAVNDEARVNRFARLRLKQPLNELFHEKRVKALWVQGWQVMAYWQAVWQAYAEGIPVWLRGESNDLAPISKLKEPLKRVLLGQLFARIQYFLYIGQANRRLYERYGVQPQQLRPAPYCVDNDRFTSQAEALSEQRASIRRAWGVPEDAVCILFAGKLIRKKRPFDLIEAVRDARLQNLSRPLHLLFVGTGELGEQLRQGCHVVFDAEVSAPRAAKIAKNDDGLPQASFVGFLNQTAISRAYVAADCMVLPSDYGETWGLVVNEAMASGLPCLASDACGCAEDLVAPLDPELRFRFGEPKSLSRALCLFIEQPDKARGLREQVAKFNLDASVATVRNLYQHVIG